MDKKIESDEELLQALALDAEFGASRVQRLAGWGYNRAAWKIDEWVQCGKIRQTERATYKFVVCAAPAIQPSASLVASICGKQSHHDGAQVRASDCEKVEDCPHCATAVAKGRSSGHVCAYCHTFY